MKKLFIAVTLIAAYSCTNPEDHANMHNDTTDIYDNEEINSAPGPITNDDTTLVLDTSHLDSPNRRRPSDAFMNREQ